MSLRFDGSLRHRYSSISGCANKTNASNSSSNVIISRDMIIDGDCSYDVLRCASKTRQMFRTAVTVVSQCMGAHYIQGSTRPAHSATLFRTHCNWKIVSNVDDELGIAVMVCIYVCLQYLNTVSSITTGLHFEFRGAGAPRVF